MEEKKFHGLDHLRALAILMVLTYHYRAFKHPAWIDTIGSVGWTGVDLFFVLSGFLISNQLFKEFKKTGAIKMNLFLLKRFFRILPPYLFTLLLYIYIPVFREKETLPPIWKFLTFTQNYGLDVIHKGTFSHAWSLCIEEQFYLLLPLSLGVLIRIKGFSYLKLGIMLLLLISIFIRAFSWYEIILPHLNSPDFWKQWYQYIYYPTYTRLDGLAIGVLIGHLYQYSKPFKKMLDTKGNLLLLTGMIAISFSFWFCQDQTLASASILGFSLVAISYGIILIGAISSSSFLAKNKSVITSQLAMLSYAIYLSHKGVIHLTQRFVEKNHMVISDGVLLLCCFLLCLAVAVFYRFFIEKPASIFKNRIINL
ncbi:acyltransferase family protein [Pedobacter sp. MR22-3]|uniref:acyltransferase family protein n=1 Tax=Pedobacter sp. MR22-3 TaxID=2994552 RepID=UPI002246869C|nr:acyltransferase [Pedobacter sp. MR22-3]MCX2585303.1 acyltransferase [Pedobacter sp. MR22-3]